ncbi:hypothetical protein TDB9533_00088 [Thalassocella blandensis]|nr:hypothetical protein TDB9533_00088 [Thalassocella blandensis]
MRVKWLTIKTEFLKFLLVSAVVGVACIIFLELLGGVFPDTFYEHQAVIFGLVYLLGTVFNFYGQSKFVMHSKVSFKKYTVFLIFSILISIASGSISSFLYANINEKYQSIFGAKSLCLILTVVIISPFTYKLVSKILK